MCGISALFSSAAAIQPSQLAAMTKIIRHRGPDDEGYFLWSRTEGATLYGGSDTPAEAFRCPLSYCPKEHISGCPSWPAQAALGHRRLSILDLTPAGHQPMCSQDGRIWITYNGEIYNYLEVRRELVQAGRRFATESDTEVILQAYQEWGRDCLHKFNGMFAFVLFDTANQKIFAARDRYGVKPLYYWRSPQGILAFASEIKQFTVLKGWDPQLNAQRAYDFLNWGLLDSSKETLFQGVLQLRGGEFLEIPLNNVSEASLCPQVWYLPTPRPFKGSFQEAAEEFRTLFEDAVRLRLRADVPVGSCLSGGLDSSSIVCIVRQLLGEGALQKTFSACSHHPRFDESPHIRAVIAATGVEAHYTHPDADSLLEEYGDILWHQDEPYPTTSIFAQWQVFKLVKEHHVKVMLDGQGADEQLGGYQGFFGNTIYDLFSTGQWGKMLNEISAVKKMHPHLTPWMLLFNKLIPDPLRQPIRRALGKSAARPAWLNTQSLNISDEHPLKGSPGKTLASQSLQQISHTSLPMLLHFEDRDSMAHSVESRTPFLDYRLVEFNLGLPGDHKVSQGWTKRVLREAMKDILPPAICWRVDKMGFVTAEKEWVCRERPEHFQALISKSIDASQGILNSKARLMAQEMIAGKREYNPVLWRQIAFAKWLEIFKVSSPCTASSKSA